MPDQPPGPRRVRQLRGWLRRRWSRRERDLEDELRFHLDCQTAQNIARGMDAGEARRRARMELEGVAACKEACRDVRRTAGLENLLKDFRYAARALCRSPLFAVSAAATLALGMGAATAIFSVTDAVLLRPLPYHDSGRLTLVARQSRNARSFLYSNADFFDLREGSRSIFEDMGGVAGFRAFVSTADGGTEQISKALVTTNFFRLMGARIVLGRDFTDADGAPEPAVAGALIPAGRAAILSYEYWQRRFAGSAAAIGREMPGTEGQRGPRIVGVLAPAFKLFLPPAASTAAAPEFYVANNIGYDNSHRNLLMAGAIGRLKRGMTLREAQQRMDALAAAVLRNSFIPTAVLRLEPMSRYLVEEVRPGILALMGAVVLLLLIACANVAGLLLVRGSLRERELAVRSALGGSRARLVRQMLAEALLISGLGTVLGIGLAWGGIRALTAVAPADLPRIEGVTLDWHALAFATACGMVAVAVFGLMPALRAARPDSMQVLRASGRTAASATGGRLRSGAVIAEVALSFVLLIGAGLLFRSFLELRRVDPGYDPRGMLTFYVTRDWPLPRQQGRMELLREIQNRLRALPGVENVTEALMLPLGGTRGPALSVRGATTQPSLRSADGAQFQQVMPGYFETLHTPLLAGRTFDERDNAPGRNLVVIDDLLAERAFPNQPAVGQRISLPPPNPPAEVIGVVGHQRLVSLSEPARPTVFVADGFWGIGVSRYWFLRAAGDPLHYAAAVRREMAAIDRRLVVSKIETMRTLVERDRGGTRFALLLMATFAAIAVLLAGVGLYGVVAGAARQRTAEIGVRIAMGADAASIFRLVVGRGLRLTAVGVAAGLAAAAALTRTLASLLVGVKATDAATFAVIAALFLALGAAASWLPAARAARLDPVVALRDE